MFFERVACFWAKVPFNWSVCMSLALVAIEYGGLHVFWLKSIPSVCMLIGDDAIQLRSQYVFGLEVSHVAVSLVFGPSASFHFTCFRAGAISSP